MKKNDDNYTKKVNEACKYKVYCKCGHSMVIYPFEHIDKKICSWCGHYVYKNDLVKFKDLLNKERKKEVKLCL